MACLLLGVVAPVPVPAQTPAPAATPPPHQFIFVLETSRTMQRRVPAMLAVAKDLLDSKFTGQLKPGDLIGVWAYNQDLRTNELEPEEWSASAAVRVLNRIQAQKYDRRAAPDNVLPVITKAISQLSRSTLILLSSGEGTIRGTAFDGQINDAWQRWRDDQAKARQPMVTVIRARNGVWTGWTVTPAPWPIEFPALQPEPARQVAQAARPSPRPDTLVTPRATLPSNSASGNASPPAPPSRTNAVAAAAPRLNTSNPPSATLPPAQGVAPAPLTAASPSNPRPPAAVTPNTQSRLAPTTAVRAREADPPASNASAQASSPSATRAPAPAASAPSPAANTNAPPPAPAPKAESPSPAPTLVQSVPQTADPQTSAPPASVPPPPTISATNSAPPMVVATSAQPSAKAQGFWGENKYVVIILGVAVVLAVWFFVLWLRTFRRPVQDLAPEVFRRPAAPEQERIADQAVVQPPDPKTEP